MNKFQLFLDTCNAELFAKATSELGTIFYKQLDMNTFLIVYFSGSRIAKFQGEPNEQIMRLCEACGFKVDDIIVDEENGSVKIHEKEAEP